MGELQRVVNCKVVYWGPPGAGKSTSLAAIQAAAAGRARRPVLSAGDGPAAPLFDYLAIDPMRLEGVEIRLHVYALSGRPREDLQESLLRNLDAVVFVADATDARVRNQSSLDTLVTALAAQGVRLADVPFILQWSKSDSAEAVPPASRDLKLGPGAKGCFESSTFGGDGALLAFKCATSAALQQRCARQGLHLKGRRRLGKQTRRIVRTAAREVSWHSPAMSEPTETGARVEVKGVKPSGRLRRLVSALAGILS